MQPLDFTPTTQSHIEIGILMSAGNNAWNQLSMAEHAAVLVEVYFYLENVISVFQGDPTDCSQFLRHIFHMVGTMLCPSNSTKTHQKKPIYLKKLNYGDTTCLHRKLSLAGHFTRLANYLHPPTPTPPPTRSQKFNDTLSVIRSHT